MKTSAAKRARLENFTTEKTKEFVDTFVENRLFVTQLADDGGVAVTVAHEALLWHWPRVSDWVGQNRENLRIRARVAEGSRSLGSRTTPLGPVVALGQTSRRGGVASRAGHRAARGRVRLNRGGR